MKNNPLNNVALESVESLLDRIKFGEFDSEDLMMYAIQTSLSVPDRKLLSLYSETPNNNISELARQLKSSNYIVKKEIHRINSTLIEKYNHLKTLYLC